jgi:hypothetical protein
MKNGRYLPWALALGLVIPLAAVLPAQAAEEWVDVIENRAPVGSEAVSVDEYGGFEKYSSREVAVFQGPGDYESWNCESGNTSRGDCDLSRPEHSFSANSILSFCETAAQENCVEGLEIGPAGGTLEPARFVRHVNSRTYPEIKSQGLMAGGATSLFESSVLHSGGTGTYAATVVAQVGYDRLRKVFRAESLNVAVYGYVEDKNPSHDITYITTGKTRDGKERRQLGFGAPSKCKWIEKGACGLERAFAPGIEVKLIMRVPDTITGWFRGRLKAPQIALSQFSSKNTRVIVQAEPVQISRMYSVVQEKDVTQKQRDAIWANCGSCTMFKGGGRSIPFSHWGEFNYIELFRNNAKDTAATTTSHWSFSTIDNASGNPCLASKSKLLGIVTTNATMYNGIVPAFRNGQLNYEVSGMHYQPDGSLSLGTYDLVMRSEVARCLYGFSKAPLNAKVSVVNNKGERFTATTVVGEKNGWLRLAAYGFTFSKKTIKVKLNQKPRR